MVTVSLLKIRVRRGSLMDILRFRSFFLCFLILYQITSSPVPISKDNDNEKECFTQKKT